MLEVAATQKSQLLGRSDSSRIRVGFVMHVMQVAGAEVLVKQIIERLNHDIEATVFCLDALGELGQQLLDNGVPVIVLNRQPGLDRLVAKRLAGEIATRKIEVLHAHQYTPFFYSALARMLYKASCKVIFTEHGRHYPDIVSWKRRWVNRMVLQRYADITTACCDFSAEAVRKNEGIPQTITLPNGVDLRQLAERGDQSTQRLLRNRLGLDANRPYVACIARFHPVKDHVTLLRGWQQVVKQVDTAKLLLVGNGPEKSNCEKLAKELGIDHSVEFWGIRHDVCDILRAVDAFSLTSVSEAASLTLLEAMASQCPVVVTNVGGNGEHVTDGIHGFLIPRGDHKLLAQQLSKLLTDAQLAQRMGKAARKRVIDQFDLRNVIESYAGLYSQLVGRSLINTSKKVN